MARLLVIFVAGMIATCAPAADSAPRPPVAGTGNSATGTSRYRAIVNTDMSALLHTWTRAKCNTRETCLNSLAQLTSDTEVLLRDADASPPAALVTLVRGVDTAGAQFLEDVSSAAVEVRQPTSNFEAAANRPDPSQLHLAVARVICSPSQPNQIGEGDYSCR